MKTSTSRIRFFLTWNKLSWDCAINATSNGQIDLLATVTTGFLFWKKHHVVNASAKYNSKHKYTINTVQYDINNVKTGVLDFNALDAEKMLDSALNIACSMDQYKVLPPNWNKSKLDEYFPLPPKEKQKNQSTVPQSDETRTSLQDLKANHPKKTTIAKRKPKSKKNKDTLQPPANNTCGQVNKDCCGMPEVCLADHLIPDPMPEVGIHEIIDPTPVNICGLESISRRASNSFSSSNDTCDEPPTRYNSPTTSRFESDDTTRSNSREESYSSPDSSYTSD